MPIADTADGGNRNAARLNSAADLGHHVQRHRTHRRTAIAAMGALAIDGRRRRHLVEIDRDQRIDRVDQRDAIGAAGLRGLGRPQDVGDVGRQLDQNGHARRVLHPARHLLHHLGHLAHGRAHAAFAHAVRTAEIEFDAVAAGFLLDPLRQIDPGRFLDRRHDRADQRAIGPFTLHLLHLVEIELQRAIGDQFDIVEADQVARRVVDRAVTRRHVDDRRVFAERLPHHAAPARLEGADDVVFLIRRRRRGQPERVGRFDAGNFGTQVGHGRFS